ncbi:MAG: peptidoglycan DD-metalloendopeptidase family protein [Anaerolineales bacterium]|nr:peptidoglycan DD-metalloendopeptidase family protein [Anaerolineales bacterium]
MSPSISLKTRPKIPGWLKILVSIAAVLILVTAFFIYRQFQRSAGHFIRLRQYWEDPEKQEIWGLRAGERCGDAPFLIPTDGFVAFFWGDRYPTGRKHQGVDIFSPVGSEGAGVTPVLAASDGYLTRLSDWRSAVIVRIPNDPLQGGRQIWTYYTHMAQADGSSFISSEFPPGTVEAFVQAGTLLGYQGNYSANPSSPTGVHLHFSIVRDNGRGQFLNELEYSNTLDPTPYLGVELNGDRIGDQVARCP